MLIFIGICIFLIGVIVGVAGFARNGSSGQLGGTPSQTPSPTPFAVQTGKAAKGPADCSLFRAGDFAQEFKPEETGDLPDFFPVPPQQSWLCGYVPSRKSVYFISSLEDKILLDNYRVALEQRKCTSTGIQTAPPERTYAYSLPFTCLNGSGVVATLATVSAYVVNYYPR